MVEANPSLEKINPEVFLSILGKLNIPVAIADKEGDFIWQSDGFEKTIQINSREFHIESISPPLVEKLNKGESIYFERNGFTLKIAPVKAMSKSTLFIYQVIDQSPSQGDKELVKEVAHDFNNIFANILNSAELLKKSVPDKNKSVKLLSTIVNNSSRGAEIIEDLLSFSDKTKNTNRDISLGSLLNEILDSFRTSLSDNIELISEVEDKLGILEGRYTDLYRVVMNLFVNAKEAIRGKGKIIIRAKKISGAVYSLTSTSREMKTEFVSIWIEDTGCGIPKENLCRIFEKGFSTKNRNRESGLGLRIVKDIVQKHGGCIEVSSEVGKGTSFQLYFPLKSEEENLKYSGLGKTLLIAEDDLSLQELLVDLLESYDFNIITANNGLEVLETLNSELKIDLLIIDRKMPVMDGVECIREIKRLGYELPIIFASGSSLEDIELYNSLHVDKILNKPYNFEKLLLYTNELTG